MNRREFVKAGLALPLIGVAETLAKSAESTDFISQALKTEEGKNALKEALGQRYTLLDIILHVNQRIINTKQVVIHRRTSGGSGWVYLKNMQDMTYRTRSCEVEFVVEVGSSWKFPKDEIDWLEFHYTDGSHETFGRYPKDKYFTMYWEIKK